MWRVRSTSRTYPSRRSSRLLQRQTASGWRGPVFHRSDVALQVADTGRLLGDGPTVGADELLAARRSLLLSEPVKLRRDADLKTLRQGGDVGLRSRHDRDR